MSEGSKKILFVAFQFPPQGGPAVHRSFEFANGLAEKGHQVTVITQTLEDLEATNKSIDHSYDARMSPNLKIERLPSYEPRKTVAKLQKLRLFRVFWYFLYPLFWESAALWTFRNTEALNALLKLNQYNLVYTTSGPFSSLLMGRYIKKNFKIPWIADFRDPLTDAYMWNFPSKFHWLGMRFFERLIFKLPDHVIVVTPEMRDMYLSRGLIEEDRISVITNGF